ncbi:MAG: exosortase-associated EpsI family protein [Phycisphaerales bacterium]|nr:MAG: exosortase-associated EpsI family protein [Phycisphaerales bacterium]
MNRRTIIRNRVMAAAPWLTLILLAGLGRTLPVRVEHSEQAEQRKAEIAAAMQAVPRFIGDWVGEDWKVPPSAQKLLRPNAIFSRSYLRLNRIDTPPQRLQVLLVHCGDARDMIGHYPPICYPSSGWVDQRSEEPRSAALTFEGRRVPVRVYRFRRTGDDGHDQVIRIFNAFILPDGKTTREIDAINRQSERLAVSVQGVAQLQIITSPVMSGEEALQAAGQLLGGMTDLFDALGLEQGAASET